MKDFIHESCWKKKVFLAVMHNFGEGISRLKYSTSASYLLMVIWRDIYLVDPLEPSTLHLHKPLWKQKKGQNDRNTFRTEPQNSENSDSQDTGEKWKKKSVTFFKTRDSYFQGVRGTWPQTHWVHRGWWPRVCSRCWQLVKEKGSGKKQVTVHE